jgi:hypothetical protein
MFAINVAENRQLQMMQVERQSKDAGTCSK